jgi:FlaA1/EpsC-like NDP-sugar epimerase
MRQKISHFWGIYRNRGLAIIADLISIILAFFFAYCFRFSFEDASLFSLLTLGHFLLIVLPIQFCFFVVFGLYRGVWRFASIPDLIRIIKASAFGALFLVTSWFLLASHHTYALPRSVPLLYFIFLILILGSTRTLYRFCKNYHGMGGAKRVLIIGAGDAGEGLIRDLFRHAAQKYRPIVILDDHPVKHGRDLHGVRVVGKITDLQRVALQYQIEHIFIAIPSMSAKNMRKIVDLCEVLDLPYSTLPSLQELTSSQVNLGHLRQVSVEDLIGREEVHIDTSEINHLLNAEVILVTGGGGSIGSELCRQIARFAPKKLIVLDHSEFNLYQIDQELYAMTNQVQYEICLGSITDPIFMDAVFKQHSPKIVFHAAAYKHVPMLESQHEIAIQNNVLGTKIVADLAIQYQVKKFIFISTDKAVNPTNIMGATKRAAESYCQACNQNNCNTKFMVVRFGNVLNSAGSVVPLFRKQIEQGGPVTVTHPEITRYFMTIPEACRLILQAGSLGLGRETFVLDMGEPIKIQYIAERLIQFSGKELGREIEIIHTGLRPGEKLFEELFYKSETLTATSHKKIMQSCVQLENGVIKTQIDDLLKAFYSRSIPDELIKKLKEIVPEYQV